MSIFVPALPYILTISVVLQLASTVTALVLSVKSGFYRPWIIISFAIFLMGLRRILSFTGMIRTATFPASAVGPELIALVISLLMFTGLLMFRPAFELLTRRQKEELDAKDLLIRETHHHVKNDLQMLESLVSLQEGTVGELAEKQFLRDLQLRIHSFSLLHEFIYKSGLSITSFREYLESIVATVARIHGDGRVRVRIQLEDIPVDRRDLLYCGLIVNEALTNSFKYAFQDKADPVITLSARAADGKVHLVISDNGIGLSPEILAGRSDSYGLTLIRGIGSNSEWDVVIHGTDGTSIEISFPAGRGSKGER